MRKLTWHPQGMPLHVVASLVGARYHAVLSYPDLLDGVWSRTVPEAGTYNSGLL
jgi:hypothetical protein